MTAHQSDLVDLLGHHDGVLLGDLLPGRRLVVEGALVGVRVAVHGAEGPAAAALEPSQPDLLAAGQASVARWLWGLLLHCLLVVYSCGLAAAVASSRFAASSGGTAEDDGPMINFFSTTGFSINLMKSL